MDIRFVQQMRPSYKRVNKTSSFNTRCFPDHCVSGHTDCSFCGRPFVISTFGFDNAASPLLFFAEFAMQAASPKKNASAFNPEGYHGEVCANGIVVFNGACAAWKYSWKSSRHTYDTPHVLRVYAYAPDTGDVVFSADSAHFTVSSTLAADVDGPSADLLIVFAAMGKLVPAARASAPSMDLEFDFDMIDALCADADDSAFDLDSLETASVSLNPEDEARFLAHEQLRNTLQRLYAYMIAQYGTWRTASQMHTDVDVYLHQSEALTIEKLAHECTRTVTQLLPLGDLMPATVVPPFTHADAAEFVRTTLDADEHLVDTIVLGGANDPSGFYVRPIEFINFMAEQKIRSGWSPVDLDIVSSSTSMVISSISPKQVFVAFLGKFMHSDMYQLGVPNSPADARPTMFRSGSSNRLLFVFPTNKSFIQVVRPCGSPVGSDMSGVIVIMRHTPLPAASLVDLKVYTAADRSIFKHHRFTFSRVQW